AGRVTAREPVEYVGQQVRWDTRPVVLDRDGDRVGREPDGDEGTGRGVRARVGEQVRQYLMQPGRVPGHRDGLRRQVQPPAVLRRGHVRVADRVDDQAGQVDGLPFQRAAGVQPGE